MKVLCIGDVVGSVGCKFLRSVLPAFKKMMAIDLVICNGENSADGNGVTVASAEYLLSSSVDVLTLGNHSFHRKEVYSFLEDNNSIIRPYNFPDPLTPGRGICNIDMGRTTVSVVNLMGQEFMDNRLDSPFFAADKALKECEGKIVIVDFHAEATSEKRAMGFYLDGRVSALFGTHTHVQTADEQILENGTGYITDVGMTGTIQSVLGVKKEIVIKRFLSKLPERFDNADGECRLDCILFDIDEKTAKTISVERFELK